MVQFLNETRKAAGAGLAAAAALLAPKLLSGQGVGVPDVAAAIGAFVAAAIIVYFVPNAAPKP